MSKCFCKKCGHEMIGYDGDDECSDCWMGFDHDLFEKMFEESYFKRTGKKKKTSEICRSVIGM